MPQPNQITPAQLLRLIPGSFALPHDRVDPSLARRIGQRVIVVCQKERKLSEGVAVLLRAQGIDAQTLEGGSMAWAASNSPMIPMATLPTTNLWVTRHRPKIDHVACPWLIRRFVDPNAQFLFVAPSEVASVADRFNALPFDIEAVRFNHRGNGCTFDAMIADFGLASDALNRLAIVVPAADTDRHDHSPQTAGLIAIFVGLSRQYRDDLEQLQAGMTPYDALYRRARDGHDEGHDWPAGRAQ
jgi:hypothetical protein